MEYAATPAYIPPVVVRRTNNSTLKGQSGEAGAAFEKNRRKNMTTITYGRETVRTGRPAGPVGIMGRVRNFIAKSRAERQLAALDDRMLADIGLKRSELLDAERRKTSRFLPSTNPSARRPSRKPCSVVSWYGP